MALDGTTRARWQSSTELDQKLTAFAHRPQLATAAALSHFLRAALPTNDFVATGLLGEAIVASEEGLEAIAGSGLATTDPAEQAPLMLALLTILAHHELLIDLTRCDWDAIENELSKQIRERRLLLPHRFGRMLYDKFNDTCRDDRPDHLLPVDVLRLLEGTPQGVYQAGAIISGPYGLLRSHERRMIPPTRRPHLWHCSDPGCRASHSVHLLPSPEIPLIRYTQAIERHLVESLGPSSDWDWALKV